MICCRQTVGSRVADGLAVDTARLQIYAGAEDHCLCMIYGTGTGPNACHASALRKDQLRHLLLSIDICIPVVFGFHKCLKLLHHR